jgi:hypothetical protein
MLSPVPGTAIYDPAVTVQTIETKSPGSTPLVHFADANQEGHVMYVQQPRVCLQHAGEDLCPRVLTRWVHWVSSSTVG